MPSLALHRLDETETKVIGPYDQFRMVGPYLRADHEFEIVACYVNRYWRAEGKSFLSCACDGPVTVHFGNADGSRSEAFGPFDSLHIVDGEVHGGDELLAQLLPRAELWRCLHDDTYWRAIILESPPESNDGSAMPDPQTHHPK